MQRTIEIADFELPRGPVTIAELMAMEPAAWEHLRAEINLRRWRHPDRPLARCRLCGGAVYIRAQATATGRVPLFAHYAEARTDCPWHQGTRLIPDDARAAQYRGHQECALHRWMCETIAGLLATDWRCLKVSVERYRKPTVEERGRYPDVHAELAGLGRFAFEVQLSKPFAFEIAARHRHYEAEGVSLIWVFRELPPELPQGFRDVITLQRGNAFLFDDAAMKASAAAGELVLSAWLEDAGGWLQPRLVSLSDLDLSSGRSVFLEDRRTARLLRSCRDARAAWWKAFRAGGPFEFGCPFVELRFEAAWESVKTQVPALVAWKDELWHERRVRGRPHFLEVAAMLFSIARSAECRRDQVYVPRYRGEGALAAMLKHRLSSPLHMPYAALVETMLAATRTRHCLARASLRTAIARAREQAVQVAPGHPVWEAAARLFPEVFDRLLRAELSDLGTLPGWAAPDLVPARKAA